MSGMKGSSSSASSTSQTATPATDTTSQNVQTGAAAKQAQASLGHSIQALQALQAAQQAARTAAIGNLTNNLGLDPNHPGQSLPIVMDGLGGGSGLRGGLVPASGALAATNTPSIQIVKLGTAGNNTLNLTSGGTVVVPEATTGGDKVTVTGPGSVTSTGGSVTATAGSLTTSSGATISSAQGGAITLTAGSGTLSVVSTTNLTSTAAGTITLANGGGQFTLAAGTATTIPAGSTISFSGSGADKVTIASSVTGSTSPSTVALNGAGTLTLANTPANGTGGTITTSTGAASFSSGITTTLPAGSTINLSGAGSLSFSGAANDSLSVLVNTGQNANTNAGAANFTTTGTILNTTSFVVPQGWKNVGALSQSIDTTTSHYTDTVTQSGQQALLTWSNFDIGKNTTLSFDQSAGGANVGQWVAINEITSPSLVPSQILGAIKAPGQVYVINQNGIIFGGSSQVNVGALTASALALNPTYIQNGLLNNAANNYQFQFSSLFTASGGTDTPLWTYPPTGATVGSVATGDVAVQAGAQLSSPTNENHEGGRVALIGPNVTNDGTISTPDGQTILAAGLQVGLAAHNSSDPSLRGLDVYIGQVSAPGQNGGTVTNAASTFDSLGNILTPGGDIEAPRADVTMVGSQVNQLGIINSSTSVTLNGRVDLLANYGAFAVSLGNPPTTSVYSSLTGTVTLGASSITAILPETSSSDTITGAQLAESSQVNIEGKTLEFDSGSLVYAPSGKLALNAGVWASSGPTLGTGPTLFTDNGEINLQQQAVLDVSGSEDVSASVAENIVAVQLRGPELANSSLQQNGALRGTTVYIDLRDTGVYNGVAWVGTPIGDVSGYVNNVERTVGELTTSGGSITANGGNVNFVPGSVLNVAGGWINYAGANVQTTEVVSNGQILNISQATPNLFYGGIYQGFTTSSPKWGVSQSFINSLLSGSQYDPGYIQGGNGGSIAITAPAATLGGSVYGNTVAGANQRAPLSSLSSTYSGATFLPTTLAVSGVPLPSSLSLSFQELVKGAAISVGLTPNVMFQTDSYISQNTPETNQIFLSQDIVNLDGFSMNLTNSGGTISVPVGVSLTTIPGGNLSFAASNIDIEGDIAAPGGGTPGVGTAGGLSFTVGDSATGLFSTPQADPATGKFILGANASLSSTGLIVNDSATAAAPGTIPLLTAGGSILITGLQVDLQPGSKIDVSGGAVVNSSGKITYGNAGSISILGGRDSGTPSLVTTGAPLPGTNTSLSGLILGSTMTGYSGNAGGGGSLTIQAPLIQIGGAQLDSRGSFAGQTYSGETGVTGNGNTVWLNSANGSGDFFSQGGFGKFKIEGIGQIATNSAGAYLFDSSGNPIVNPAMYIADNTVIDPTVQSYAGTFNGSNFTLAPIGYSQEANFLPSQRTAVNLTFTAEGVTSSFRDDLPPVQAGSTASVENGLMVRGDLIVGNGAVIQTDPQTNAGNGVSLLASNGTVAELGEIVASGGKITISGGNTIGLNSNQLLFYNGAAGGFPTVDLGPNSELSTQGVFEQTANPLGYRTGSVLPGGSIVISGNIVAEANANLNVSGAEATVSETAGSLNLATNSLNSLALMPTRIDSNGGAITFNATQLLYNDATLVGRAAGSSAVGGTLNISSGLSNLTLPSDATLIISQQGLNQNGYSLPTGTPSGLALLDGQAIPGSTSALGATINTATAGLPIFSYFAVSTNLFVSNPQSASLSDNGGVAGGFDSLNVPGTVDFAGDVSISTSNSISLALSSRSGQFATGGVLRADGSVTLTAPYVALNSFATAPLPDQVTAYPAATAGTVSQTVNPSNLTDVGNVSLLWIGTLNFNGASSASGFVPGTTAGDVRGIGMLQVAGTINLNAGQIYPPTEETFTIEGNTVSITAPTGQNVPYLPLSGGGTLNIFGTTIEQDGVLRAPFGVINLGNSSTNQLTLSAGSITSVSGFDPRLNAGITVPYGIVDQNGTWFDPQGNNISLIGPPAKAIHVSGQNVDIQTGSTIDTRGGGELMGYSFTSGTGGTIDLLASSKSFAIVPTLSSNDSYAPDGTYANNSSLSTNGVQDVGYFNSSLAVGEQIVLDASNGLPAGTYTLLPARYALLPGAFLITASSSPAAGATVAQPDGTSLVSGYLTSSLNPTASPVYNTFQVYSQSLVLAKAPYTANLADTYFPASAANNNLSTPRLPGDSGQLVLNATTTMTINGTLLSAPGVGGLGGEVDISSPENIYIVGPNFDSAGLSNALILDSAQLTNFGAASLLIGGFRTSTSSGTNVTVTTNMLVVDNSGATTTIDGTTVDGLAAPDIILVSKKTLEVNDNSVIEQYGELSGSSPTLTLQGDGALLRISSDPSAQIVRQNVVTAGNAADLSIGAGVQLSNASGAPAGALILDSSLLVSLSPLAATPPVLSAKSLTLDSSLINIELGTPATAPISGLVITSNQIDSLLASTQSLSLLSYSSIAFYGGLGSTPAQIGTVTTTSGGTTYQLANLSLHADDIYYADTQASAGITINAQTVSIDNLPGGTNLPSLAGLSTAGALTINAQTISLGSNTTHLDGFTNVALNASSAILLKGLGAVTPDSSTNAVASSLIPPVASGLSVGGNLTLTTPLITGATASDQTISSSTTSVLDMAISATGALVLSAPASASASPAANGLGAQLSLTGSSVTQNSGSIKLHSGTVSLQATGAQGSADGSDVTINGVLDVSGTPMPFYNLNKFTDGGQINLTSQQGNVSVGSTGLVNLSGASGTGTSTSGAANAGSLSIQAGGTFSPGNPGQIEAQAGTVTQSGATIAQGVGGNFNLDVGSLLSTGPGDALLSSLETNLPAFATQSIRDRNDSSVTVDGTVVTSSFNLSVDNGSISVAGEVNASNVAAIDPTGSPILIGGSIDLQAGGSISLSSTAILNASGMNLNNAGQGGSITLAAGSFEGTANPTSNAAINIASGSQIILGVNGTPAGNLHLRAPQVADNTYTGGTYSTVTGSGGTPTDVAVAPIAGNIIQNAGSINVEGFYVQNLPGANSIIDTAEGNATTNASNFMANAGTIATRIFGASVPATVEINPGEEIDNTTGNLELQSTWDFGQLRYGAPLLDSFGNQQTNLLGNTILTVPGYLTLRAAGNLNLDFGASLTDGFDDSFGLSNEDLPLPVGSQSWTYTLTTGGDFTAANLGAIRSPAQLSAAGLGGSLQVGYQNTSSPVVLNTGVINSPNTFFQTIRTGTGNITINAGGSVLLLNNLATIYTSGSEVDSTDGGLFNPPLELNPFIPQDFLGAYDTTGGGNVTIFAQGNIAHEAYTFTGALTADSSPELPSNWLDREGDGAATPTSWWVDFTNFFDGVGALGGGNVTLTSGGSVVNVDASAPTNAREINGQMLKLGGGNVTVRAGDNIDGGVYYVEQGQGSFRAGNSIQTNSTRAAVSISAKSTSADWLPTTFFLGEGSLNISAVGNVLMGTVTNPFLLPQSSKNMDGNVGTSLADEVSYFSTYDLKHDSVNLSSLTGAITIKATLESGQGTLLNWYANVLNATVVNLNPGDELSDAEPWLTLSSSYLSPTSIGSYGTPAATLPGSPANVDQGVIAWLPSHLYVTAYTGDVNLLGGLTLLPSSNGNLNLLAAGSINAFQVNQVSNSGASLWGSAAINISDADPNILPTPTNPFSSIGQVDSLGGNFAATGATSGLTLQQKQQLHAEDANGNSLHTGDNNPVLIYAQSGDISGLTLFSPKETQISAGQDITDIAFYIQNNAATDITTLSAGRDIIAYDASSPSRAMAGTNILGYNPLSSPVGAGVGAPNAGDIQISGPGALEVLAGRNLTLGDDASLNPNNPKDSLNAEGLFSGLTSVGGSLNPFLPFTGANIIAAAGLGSGVTTGGVLGSDAGGSAGPTPIMNFANAFLDPNNSSDLAYLNDLAPSLGLTNAATPQEIRDAFDSLSTSDPARQDVLTLNIFYLVLRDAGRDHNLSGSPGFGNYNTGFAAIGDLFPSSSTTHGDINITSREIKTTNDGDINLLTPGGQVTVGVNVAGSGQAVDQGILTVDGGNISVFADGSVNVGTSRIFTLHGGNEILWSTHGDIDAGASSKTVVSAPPTRVIVDPTSGDVQLDLAGLATGGGIGVLATVAGAGAGDVDLIAPAGVVNAGDAGIRASGNLNISALKVVNADNISVGGKSSGVPATASANIGALSAASAAAGSSSAAASNGGAGNQRNPANSGAQDLPSIITVDVLGYGGDDGTD